MILLCCCTTQSPLRLRVTDVINTPSAYWVGVPAGLVTEVMEPPAKEV